MALRILLQLAIIGIPFMAFGLYLLLSTAAEEEGRRKWPIKALFAVGISLSLIVWVSLILREGRSRHICYEPPVVINGEIVKREYPCERDTNFGVPLNDNPGVEAHGVKDPEDIRDPSDIKAHSPDLDGREDPSGQEPENGPENDTPN